jgi:DNA polymerase-1
VKQECFYIVDVSSFIFRAFYAIRMLNAPDGTPVNAVYGVLSMLLKILQRPDCQYVVLAQDSKEKSFRSEIFEAYKANRSEPPDELKPQFALIDNLLDTMGIARIKIPGFEADDIIGTLVKLHKDKFKKIFIVSGDKDLFQLVDEQTVMIDTMKDVHYSPEDVKTKMGVLPHQIVDYLSLVGDSSDNIPGVKGIGEKGAAKLLEQFDNLENILKSNAEISNTKMQTALKNYAQDALLSKKLIQLDCDIKLDQSVESFLKPNLHTEKLKTFLLNYGFKSLVTKIFSEAKAAETVATKQVEIPISSAPVITLIDLSLKLKALKKRKISYFELQEKIYIYTEQDEYFIVNPEEKISLFHQLIKLEFKIFLFDSKSTIKELHLENKDTLVNFIDISLISFTLNTEGKRSLKDLASQHLSLEVSDAPEEQVKVLYQLGEMLIEKLHHEGLEKIYFNIDLPMNLVLSNMEREGILIDQMYFKILSKDFSDELAKIEKEIFTSANTSINLKSPKQVGQLLFEKLNLPALKKTKTGFSTDSSVLEKLDTMNLSPIPGLMLQYREIDKLLSTYVNSLPELIHADGRLHTTYHLTIAATGRLTSEAPNLQNIPIKTKRGQLLRKGFIAKEGYSLVAADYSQIELRILAHYCQDKAMVAAFNQGKDIHRQTAAEVFGIAPDKITDEQRNYAKAINFGLIYGQSSYGLAETLNIDQKQARDFIEKYFQKFSAVKIYLDQLREFCEKQGFAQTYLGRKRYLPDIKSSNRMLKAQAERMAINTPVQGTAADLMKMAMVELQNKIAQKFPTTKMLLQVHDEIILESPEVDVKVIAELTKQVMESAMVLTIPLKVDVSVGKNWLEMDEF